MITISNIQSYTPTVEHPAILNVIKELLAQACLPGNLEPQSRTMSFPLEPSKNLEIKITRKEKALEYTFRDGNGRDGGVLYTDYIPYSTPLGLLIILYAAIERMEQGRADSLVGPARMLIVDLPIFYREHYGFKILESDEVIQ